MNSYYLINLLIYAAVDAMACLGLSQQFGVAGVTNFGFIIFQAAGGYTAAILALPADSANGGFQSYIGGWNLPFPIPWIGAAIVGGLIALPFTFLVGRRLRGDFAAVGLLVTAVLLNLLVTNYRPLLNGDAGLSLIPQPLQGEYNPQSAGYQWVLTAVAIVVCAVVYLFVRRITESPYGRSLRAMRDNDIVADSLGKNLLSLRTAMLVTGGAIAGLSGGILVSYITTWSPAAWGYAETVVLFAAVIIGGAGNHRGAILGAILVPVGFEEVTRYIPTSNNLPPNLIPSLQWVAIGLLIVIFLWVRPQGILPERKRVIRRRDARPARQRRIPGAGGTARGQPGRRPVPPRPVARRRRAGRRRRAAVSAAPRPPAPALDAAAEAALARTPGAGDVVLQAVDVVREFGGVRAVAGVSLSVRRGTLTGLIGPNGAGKSTLLAMLAGTLPVSAGADPLPGRGRDQPAGLPAGQARPDPHLPARQRVQAAHRHGEPADVGPGQPRRLAARRPGRPEVLARRRGRGDRQGNHLARAVRPRSARQQLRRRPQRRPAPHGRDHARADGRAAGAAARRADGRACTRTWPAGSAASWSRLPPGD